MASSRVAISLLALLLAPACTTWLPASPQPRSDATASALADVVAELQLHLRDDTYRRHRVRAAQGRNVFALALWRLDRLQRRRSREPARWENVDFVIEYARARALERERRYAEARDAYARVAAAGSLLAARSEEALAVMRHFAEHAGPSEEPLPTPQAERDFLERRIASWRGLALEYRATTWEPLAREEAESWEQLRVEWFARHATPDAAIAAGRRLVERHHDSKLYPRHLIRLGDLYAEATRREYLRYRAGLSRFDPERYESWLDRAFSAYELAGEARGRHHRREAEKKIEALLASHNGVRADAP